jgi:hypothetical protein
MGVSVGWGVSGIGVNVGVGGIAVGVAVGPAGPPTHPASNNTTSVKPNAYRNTFLLIIVLLLSLFEDDRA